MGCTNLHNMSLKLLASTYRKIAKTSRKTPTTLFLKESEVWRSEFELGGIVIVGEFFSYSIRFSEIEMHIFDFVRSVW